MSTQITIVNTVQPHVGGTHLSIGRPTPNNNVYILDDKLKPVAVGESGIMWAGGAGVTRGYINLPDKTAERYRTDPFVNDGYVKTWCPLVRTLTLATVVSCSTQATLEDGEKTAE